MCTFLATGLLVATCAQAGLPRESDPGVRLYLDNHLEKALPLLERSAARHPEDPDAYAWLAECLRRLQRFDEAESAARRALVLSPDHACAHVTLCDLYNPQYSQWAFTDADSSGWHIRRAVACGPEEADVWPSAWVNAGASGDASLERRALQGMVRTGFLTPALLAYTRWALRSLPDGAVYVCNGDMDTYPAVALQVTEGLRPDVTVVNLPLLNLDWYRRKLAAQGAFPPSADSAALERLEGYEARDGEWVGVDRQMCTRWLDAIADGSFQRPLAVAVSVPDENAVEMSDRRSLAGPFWLIHSAAVETAVDTARVRESLANLDVDVVRGPFWSPADRSPIRRGSGSDLLRDNVASAVLSYVREVRKSADPERTRAAVEWATGLARAVRASPWTVKAIRAAGESPLPAPEE
jgi:tetratricopeptide (TPR) repeat protein